MKCLLPVPTWHWHKRIFDFEMMSTREFAIYTEASSKRHLYLYSLYLYLCTGACFYSIYGYILEREYNLIVSTQALKPDSCPY
jgi:hypothetical protein